jgi:TRAP-type C4-dicarboxylate transport system permease small subunit
MRGLKDPRLQRMMAAAFLLIGVLLCVMFGPEVLARTLRTEFRIKDFWTEEATLEAGMWLVIGVGCIASGCQIFAPAK